MFINNIVFVHSSIEGHLDCFHLLVTVNNAVMNWVYKYLFESLLSILAGIYPEVEFLDYIVNLSLIF